MLGNRKSGAPARSAPPKADGKPVDTIDTLVGRQAVFKGDLEFTGGLRVDGRVEGNVIAVDKSSATVVVSESGEVKGSIDAPHVIVNGAINGNIKSCGRVELQAKSRINGDVHYRAVEMALGAAINGNLSCESTGEDAAAAARATSGAAAAPGAPPARSAESG